MAEKESEGGLLEEVIGIYFHTKVTKGGRNLSCAALVAVGDGRGKLGLGYSKARGVPMAIEKSTKEARAHMVQISMVGNTIAHEVMGEHSASQVWLKPASPGTGVKAGRTVRALMRVTGVQNVLSKVFGNTNPINVAKATMVALTNMRSLEEIRRLRKPDVRLFHPQGMTQAQQPAAVGQDVSASQ